MDRLRPLAVSSPASSFLVRVFRVAFPPAAEAAGVVEPEGRLPCTGDGEGLACELRGVPAFDLESSLGEGSEAKVLSAVRRGVSASDGVKPPPPVPSASVGVGGTDDLPSLPPSSERGFGGLIGVGFTRVPAEAAARAEEDEGICDGRDAELDAADREEAEEEEDDDDDEEEDEADTDAAPADGGTNWSA